MTETVSSRVFLPYRNSKIIIYFTLSASSSSIFAMWCQEINSLIRMLIALLLCINDLSSSSTSSSLVSLVGLSLIYQPWKQVLLSLSLGFYGLVQTPSPSRPSLINPWFLFYYLISLLILSYHRFFHSYSIRLFLGIWKPLTYSRNSLLLRVNGWIKAETGERVLFIGD